ncbi:MAG: MFS transporter [Actinomycetota bacterium]|nr:MFS transporter [Actinomycetota bacterium]
MKANSTEKTNTDSEATFTPLEKEKGEAGLFHVLARRDFTILLAGAFVSNVGTWIHNSALLWLVKEMTGSDAWVGGINLANYLPILFLVAIAGSLADYLDRRKLILVSQAAMMLIAFAMGMLLHFDLASIWLIFALTLMMGIAFVFNFPAWRSIIPDLVAEEELTSGIALDAAQFNMSRFIGPSLGAIILVMLGAEFAFFINALSFLAVIVVLLLIRTDPPATTKPSGGTMGHVIEGAKEIWGMSWSRNALIFLSFFSFFGLSYIALLPGLAKDVLHMGASGFGLILGFVGLGSFVAAPLVIWLNRNFRQSEIIKFSALAFSVLLLGMSFCKTLAVDLAIAFGLGVSTLTLVASINTVLQSRVERQMRGRIMSFYILVFQGISPVGGLLFGFISDKASLPVAMGIAGAAVMVLAISAFAFRGFLKGVVSPDHIARFPEPFEG